MAEISFVVNIVGIGSVQLPVTFPPTGQNTIAIGPLGNGSLVFEVENVLDQDLTLPSLTINTQGPSASKYSVSLLSDAMVINARAKAQNTIQVQANTADINESDRAQVLIEGKE